MVEGVLNQIISGMRRNSVVLLPWQKAEASYPGASTSFTEFDPATKRANINRLLEQVNYRPESDVLVEFACGRSPAIPQGYLYELDFNARDFPPNYTFMGGDAITFPADVREKKIPGGKRKIIVMYNALNYLFDRMRSQQTLSITKSEVEVLRTEPHNSLNSIEKQEVVFGRALASITSELESQDVMIIVQENEGRRQQFAMVERVLRRNGKKHASRYYNGESDGEPVVLTLTDFR